LTKPRARPVVSAFAGHGVPRRHVLRGLFGGVGAGLAAPGLAAAHPLREHARHPKRIAAAQEKAKNPAGEPEFLDAYQLKMLSSLGERIVPGSAAAGCARFVDRLLAVGTGKDGQRLLTALGAIDGEARRRYGSPWPDLDEPQQIELLQALASAPPGRDETFWTPGTSVEEYLAQREAEESNEGQTTLRDHFDHVKGWVMGAYYSSEEGQRELGHVGPIFADSFPGCPHPDGHR
jgi:hypothetical protein